MYSDLARLWPVISPPEDYVSESEVLASVIRQHAEIAVRSLLHLGSGGGHNDYTLKLHFDVTGVDSSPHMMELARRLNPEVMYHEGDIRTVRLGDEFDAVALLDAVNYMLSEDDLRRAFETAYAHLRPGGVLVTAVEITPQSFRQNETIHTVHKTGDVEVVFIENHYDPDPSDSVYDCTFVYLIRERGEPRIETDRHACGVFSLNVWYDNLRSAGFEVSQGSLRVPEPQGEDLTLLVGVKPAH
jgi:SAM-dependent methyltransferase